MGVDDGVPLYIAPVESPRNVDLWKAVAPFVALEEMLFRFDRRAIEERAEAFVHASLPEANLWGRAA